MPINAQKIPAIERRHYERFRSSVQATVHGVLGGLLAFGIDIAAVDSNCGRAHKPGVFGRGLVADMMVRTSASRWRSARTPWTSASAAGKFGQCSTYRTSITRPGS